MEQVISGLVNGVVVPVTQFIVFAVESGVAFVVFAMLWIGFGWALIASQGSLDGAWQWLRSLPLIVQGVAWLLFLPVAVALWMWETTWPVVMRIIVVVGLAGWSLLIFLPKWIAARP